MLSDFILFVAATLTVIKLTTSHVIPPTWSGPILGAVVLGVAVLRIFGSSAFRKKARTPKVLVSLALFALDFTQGDASSGVLVAALVVGVATMMFGLYYMLSGLFPSSRSRR
jgi:hypothetical protein